MSNIDEDHALIYDELDEFKKLRLVMHDMINQVTKLDQINYKVQKGSQFTVEQMEIFNETIDKSKKLISELRDKIHFMERQAKEKANREGRKQ